MGNGQGVEALFDAAKQGNLADVIGALIQGVDVNSIDRVP